jgi:hypothetical protein
VPCAYHAGRSGYPPARPANSKGPAQNPNRAPGLAGTITYTPQRSPSPCSHPARPRITRALALLIDEINATPASLPGDQRPITYKLAKPAQTI